MFSMPQYEPPHDKTSRMACAPSEYWVSLGIRMKKAWVFAVRMKKAWVLSYQLCTQWRLWSDWFESSLCTVIWLVLSWGGSYRSFFSSSLCHEIMVLINMRPAKAQASLRIRAVSPESSLFPHMKYGRRVRPKLGHLAPLLAAHALLQNEFT